MQHWQQEKFGSAVEAEKFVNDSGPPQWLKEGKKATTKDVRKPWQKPAVIPVAAIGASVVCDSC